ncbi:hypothetical protein [Microbacterium sp. YY-01]|uniref:hypothetical protein n=1 Tax=Microbacterium sp. YY-01 TaxID=3421634 RepID=UPI003D16697C
MLLTQPSPEPRRFWSATVAQRRAAAFAGVGSITFPDAIHLTGAGFLSAHIFSRQLRRYVILVRFVQKELGPSDFRKPKLEPWRGTVSNHLMRRPS